MSTETTVTGMPVLSADDITALLAGRRNRGGHERFVTAFLDSEKMYEVVNDHADYRGKTPEQLDTSVKQGILNAAKKLAQAGNEDAKLVKVILHENPETDRQELLIINAGIVADSTAAADDTDA